MGDVDCGARTMPPVAGWMCRYSGIRFSDSAFYAGCCQIRVRSRRGFVSPGSYGLHMVLLALTMLYVGGIGPSSAALGA